MHAAFAQGADELLTDMWKMIAFASRYGHQPLLTALGPVTTDRMRRFCDGLSYLLEIERRSHSSNVQNHIAEGGG